MRMLQYRGLELDARLRPAFEKVRAAIEVDDFRSPDVKKLHVGGYCRAKLDHSNRLLLGFVRIPEADGGGTACLALEVIRNHAYDRSRFLRGAAIDEAKIERDPTTATSDAAGDATPIRWLHPSRTTFDLLDKPIVFDDTQQQALDHRPPLVVIGSAGSGKTAVTLAKLREAEGRVLYVTLSAYLAQGARALYAAHGYENDRQEVDFLSYRELLETLRVPPGREVTMPAFVRWFERHRQAARTLGDIEAHALYEEFRGVIGAQPGGPLSQHDYRSLGARQSLLPVERRDAAHELFQRYRRWLDDEGLFDPNLVAHAWRTDIAERTEPVYDFVVVDEVQDLTAVQLALVLALLRRPGAFVLCGDSHQIVHPNFFSWAQLKAMFWQGLAGEAAQRQPIALLQANFRNARRVTGIANRLLRLKQARFGSVDRESTFLIRSTTADEGSVVLADTRGTSIGALAAAARRSARHAVIVLRDDDKPAARELFATPLVFSVHEAKGLEYPHVVLFEIVSRHRRTYAEVCDGIDPGALEGDELDFRRAADKSDKSLELYKFHVNALYVAMTRAIESLTVVESDPHHPLLALLGLERGDAKVGTVRESTRDEWAQEAHRLELQGKAEQALAIRQTFLQHAAPPWKAWSRERAEEWAVTALDPGHPSAKPRQALHDYALWHGQQAWVERLAAAGFQPARVLVGERSFHGTGSLSPPRYQVPGVDHERDHALVRRSVAAIRQRHLQAYAAKNVKDVMRQADTYGIDHETVVGATPLMLAARAGNAELVRALLQRGADASRVDEFGHGAWQHAVNRALEDVAFARTGLPALFDLLAPGAIDVRSDDRLVRLERHQGEYWVLTLMLAGLKTQWSQCAQRSSEVYKHWDGFFAEQFHEVLEALPSWLWADRRRKRGYLNHVLARSERDSDYRPARRLWVRAKHGRYLPDPSLALRDGDGWRPVYEAMRLEWIDRGCADATWGHRQPAQSVARLTGRADDESPGRVAP